MSPGDAAPRNRATGLVVACPLIWGSAAEPAAASARVATAEGGTATGDGAATGFGGGNDDAFFECRIDSSFP